MRSKGVEQRMRGLGQAIVIGRIVLPLVRRAIADRRARAAAAAMPAGRRHVHDELRGADTDAIASRIARDEQLRVEVAALVRSAIDAADEGVARARRRARRRTVRLIVLAAAVIAAAAIALRKRLGALTCNCRATPQDLAPESGEVAPEIVRPAG